MLSKAQRIALVVIPLLLIAILMGVFYFRDSSSGFVWVIRVVDGDTIEIKGKVKIRLIGVDTPETKHPQKSEECFGKEATNKLNELVAGRKVRLEADKEDKDRHERPLRYIWLEDGRMLNQMLAEGGFGRAKFYSPNTKYKKLFEGLEERARIERRGLWGACDYPIKEGASKKKPRRKH